MWTTRDERRVIERTACQDRAERLPLDIFHDDAVPSVFSLNDFVDGASIRMRHGRDRASFDLKAMEMSFVFNESYG